MAAIHGAGHAVAAVLVGHSFVDMLLFKRPRPFINRTGLGDKKVRAFGLDSTGRRHVQLRVSKTDSPEPIKTAPLRSQAEQLNVPAQKVLSSTASRLQKGARARSVLLRVHAAALNFRSSSVRRHFGRCGSLPESIGQSGWAWRPVRRSPGPPCALRLHLDYF